MSKSPKAGLPTGDGFAQSGPAVTIQSASVAAAPGAAARRTEVLATELELVRESRVGRERIALVTGIVAGRYALTPDEAWRLLVGVSQKANVKLREVARLVHDGSSGRLADADVELAGRLNRLGPPGRPPLVQLRTRS